MASLAVEARAKLNLYLHVLGRRADGYHLLDSLIAFADVADRLSAEPSDGLSLAVEGPFADALAGEGDNLVLRAARRLAEAAGVPARARLSLAKNLPVAAGMGGGSADAAAALRLLCRLWGVDMAEERLLALALPLGADVPMCLHGRPAFVGGIGEEIAPAPALPPAGIVLANPRAPLATPRVFAGRSGPFSQPARFTAPPADAAALAGLLRARRNDLTAAAVAMLPAVAEGLAALQASPGCLLARMTGSGATCFGLYDDAAAARRARGGLSAALPGWWVAAGVLAEAPGGG